MKQNDDSGLARATFLFDPEAIKSADEPSRDSPRLVWMVVSLVGTGEFALDRYIGTFGRGERTFKRDVAKLRELGDLYGFAIKARKGGRIVLESLDNVRATGSNSTAPPALADTLQAVVDALGDVIGRELAGHVDLAGASIDRFLRIATPRLRAHCAVAEVYGALRDAWARSARVRFAYPSRNGALPLERIVEPYLVTYVAGRYYLIGFDVRPRSGGWRQYALDRIAGRIRLVGTFRRRTVPAAYRGEDAIGLFKTGTAVEVSVELSPTIAGAVVAREWQRSQNVTPAPNGGATIGFRVHDLGEAVRWALGFGAEARVLAPPEAVALCRKMALEIAAAHAPKAEESRLA